MVLQEQWNQGDRMSMDTIGKITPLPSAYQEILWQIDKKVAQLFGVILTRNGVTIPYKSSIITSGL